MRMRHLFIAAILALCSATVANALDRDAREISQADVEVISYKNMDAARVVVWDETALKLERDWAVVAGAGIGEFFGSGGNEKKEMYFVALGAKWYPRPTTSIQLIGSCDWAGGGGGFRLVGGTASIEHRFVTEQGAISPFVACSASIQDSLIDPWGVDQKAFTCLVFKAGGGCDLIMSSDVTLVLQAMFADSQAASVHLGRNYADGWTGTIGLKYFWF